jgi:hypothetical protein
MADFQPATVRISRYPGLRPGLSYPAPSALRSLGLWCRLLGLPLQPAKVCGQRNEHTFEKCDKAQRRPEVNGTRLRHPSRQSGRNLLQSRWLGTSGDRPQRIARFQRAKRPKPLSKVPQHAGRARYILNRRIALSTRFFHREASKTALNECHCDQRCP